MQHGLVWKSHEGCRLPLAQEGRIARTKSRMVGSVWTPCKVSALQPGSPRLRAQRCQQPLDAANLIASTLNFSVYCRFSNLLSRISSRHTTQASHFPPVREFGGRITEGSRECRLLVVCHHRRSGRPRNRWSGYPQGGHSFALERSLEAPPSCWC